MLNEGKCIVGKLREVRYLSSRDELDLDRRGNRYHCMQNKVAKLPSIND